MYRDGRSDNRFDKKRLCKLPFLSPEGRGYLSFYFAFQVGSKLLYFFTGKFDDDGLINPVAPGSPGICI